MDMPKMGVTINVTKGRAKILLVEKQLVFATSMALTRAAQDGQRAAEKRIPQAFDGPTTFTQKSVAIQAARKNKLQAKVLIKDRQAGYLALEEFGGTRTPQPGSPMNKPVLQRKNASGNIPYKAIARLREDKSVFVASEKHNRTKHLAPGIYRRPKVLRDKEGKRLKKEDGSYIVGRLKLIVGFKKEQEYKPVFGFRKVTEDELRATFSLRFNEAVANALRNAK